MKYIAILRKISNQPMKTHDIDKEGIKMFFKKDITTRLFQEGLIVPHQGTFLWGITPLGEKYLQKNKHEQLSLF